MNIFVLKQEQKIWEKRDLKHLEIDIDNLGALARMSKLILFWKRKTLFITFTESHFKYCRLIWMCHSHFTNSESIDYINWLCTRFIMKPRFEGLLSKAFSILLLLYLIFSFLYYSSMTSYFFFKHKRPCIVTCQTFMAIYLLEIITFLILDLDLNSEIKSINNKKGKNFLFYDRSVLWNNIQYEIKNLKNLPPFIARVKMWKHNSWKFRVCKPYVGGVGFI